MSEVATAELRDALDSMLGPGSIAELERRPCAYRTSHELDELDVALTDGTRLRLMLKSLSRSALGPAALRAKPEFLHDPLREIEAYRTLLADAGLGTPQFHGAVVDPDRDRYWLFIENVVGDVLWQVGELEVWQEAARWLAVLHHRFAGQDLGAAERHLLRFDAAFYRSWMTRALDFADAQRREPLEWLAARYDAVVERLAAQPATFAHGEFYASNVLIQRAGGSLRVAPIDWENAALAAGLVDLAALTTGGWSPPERDTIARGYLEQLSELGDRRSEAELLETLELFRLHLAVQWLGWDPNWSPPDEHRHDWLAEATEIARRLGL
jgi:hypothetical protein